MSIMMLSTQELQKLPMMDIFSTPPGCKIIFVRAGGWEAERTAAAKLLTVGASYTVKSIEVHSWTSYVTLVEFPNQSFNTVMFANLD